MRNFLILVTAILFLSLLPNAVAASEEKIQTRISGYLEPQIIATKDDFLMKNNLRLDLKVDLPWKTSIVTSADFFSFLGDKHWNILDFVPEKINNEIVEPNRYLYDYNYEEDILLHKAYLKTSVKNADVYIGRQQIPLGTGYVWNPTDVFNLKDTTDPTLELPGHDAVRLNLTIGSRSNLYLFYIPDENTDDFDAFKPENGPEEQAIVARYKKGLGHFDTSLVFIQRDRLLTDYVSFETIVQEQQVYGIDIAGELFSLGVWMEYAYHALKDFNDYDDFVVGVDYTFLNELYFLGEYYRNNEGKKDYHRYDIQDWTRYLFGEIKTISRDQLYLYLSYPATDLMTIGCASLTSLSDGSLQVIPSISYSMAENIETNIFLNISIGNEEKTFGESLGHSLTARMRIFF